MGLVNSLQARCPDDRFRLEEHEGKLVMRHGLPQGLAISPALCVHYLGNLAIDSHPKMVMYADDGILLWKVDSNGSYER